MNLDEWIKKMDAAHYALRVETIGWMRSRTRWKALAQHWMEKGRIYRAERDTAKELWQEALAEVQQLRLVQDYAASKMEAAVQCLNAVIAGEEKPEHIRDSLAYSAQRTRASLLEGKS